MSPFRSRPSLSQTSLARALAVALAAAPLFAACASSRTKAPQPLDVAGLAERLVEAARQRVELNRVRVVVQEIRPLRFAPPGERAAANPPEGEDAVGVALEHGFVIALASRLNVVESEEVAPAVRHTPANTLGDVAATYGATHLLIGDYQRRRDGFLVSVRLVDAESHLIVAAVAGTVAVPEIALSEDSRRLAAAAPDPAAPRIVRASSDVGGPAAQSQPAQLQPAQYQVVQPLAQQPAPLRASPSAPASATSASVVAPAAATSSAATSSTAAPALTFAATPEPLASADATEARIPAREVEDFDTWRARHAAEMATTDGARPAQPASKSAAPPRPRAPEPAHGEEFPWRSEGWLARLLGVPPTRPSERPR